MDLSAHILPRCKSSSACATPCLKQITVVSLLGLVAMSSGCAAARLTQFHNFAQAGTAYVKASQTVLDEAGAAAIDADSLIAVKGREGVTGKDEKATADKRRIYIVDEDKELRKRLLLLQEIGRHGRLLQAYFEALAALADPKAPSTLGASAQGLFDSISKLSPAIKNASLGGVTVRDKIPAATNFVVQAFKVKALETELKARSKAIEREIALQQAAFTVIGQNLDTDLKAKLQLQETQEVVEPFATSGKLPASWVSRRAEIIQAEVAAQSAQSAAEAAAKLRESFIALAQNRLSEPSITDLITAINSMLDLTEKIQKATPSK
jgi:hypothetical protein